MNHSHLVFYLLIFTDFRKTDPSAANNGLGTSIWGHLDSKIPLFQPEIRSNLKFDSIGLVSFTTLCMDSILLAL